MSVAFWSATVKAGSPVEVQPPEGFVLNLQQAALTGIKSGSVVLKVKTIAIEGDELEAVIGTLRTTTADQINLSLVFGYDVPATFTVSGDAGTVHLSGYYQPGPDGDEEEGDEFDGEEGDSDEDSEDEDEDDENTAKLLKELAKNASSANKSNSKGKVVQLPSESEDEESSEDEKMIKQNQQTKKPATPFKGAAPVPDSEDESEEDSEGEEDDSEEGSDEESEEEAPPVKVQKTAPKGIVTSSGSNKNNQHQQQNKPAQHQQQGQKSNPNTPSKQAFGKPQGQQQQGNKTPQSGGKPQHGGNNHNNKHQQSGDKRKR